MFPSVVTATHTHTVCYGQDEMAHPIFALGMQIPAALQSPIFLSTWGMDMLEKKTKKNSLAVSGRLALEMYATHVRTRAHTHTHTHTFFLST